MQITEDNHFIPQFYLKQWADANDKVMCYDLLVQHRKVPKWRPKPIRGIGYKKHLYTQIINGKESDEFEKWLDTNFETPVAPLFEKLNKGQRLNRYEIHKLVLFMMVQYLRTPKYYIDFIKRCEKQLQDILNNNLFIDNLIDSRNKRKYRKASSSLQHESNTPFSKHFHVTIEQGKGRDIQQSTIKIEVTPNRNLWIDTQKYLLNKTTDIILKHCWTILEAPEPNFWFTSDVPVVLLNYTSHEKFDLLGGWNNPGTNILMPLTPKYMLITEVGKFFSNNYQLNRKMIRFIKKAQIEAAYRSIFSNQRHSMVEQIRPRIIDKQLYENEQNSWRNWHKNQSETG